MNHLIRPMKILFNNILNTAHYEGCSGSSDMYLEALFRNILRSLPKNFLYLDNDFNISSLYHFLEQLQHIMYRLPNTNDLFTCHRTTVYFLKVNLSNAVCALIDCNLGGGGGGGGYLPIYDIVRMCMPYFSTARYMIIPPPFLKSI